MKYKVGDKVKLKSPQELYRIGWMGEAANKVGGKIVELESIDEVKGYYKITYKGDEFVFDDIEIEEEQPILFEELVKDLASIVSKHNLSVKIEEKDGGLFVKPIEKVEDDLAVDTPVMASNNDEYWILGYYQGNGNISRIMGGKYSAEPRQNIIPFDKFNPNDIEGSLKYNIVK